MEDYTATLRRGPPGDRHRCEVRFHSGRAARSLRFRAALLIDYAPAFVEQSTPYTFQCTAADIVCIVEGVGDDAAPVVELWSDRFGDFRMVSSFSSPRGGGLASFKGLTGGFAGE